MHFVKEIKEDFNIIGLKQLKLDTFSDNRGQIWTLHSEIEDLPSFVEDKLSISNYSVLRGLHGDSETDKLITFLEGHIQLAVADLRRNSPTYGNCIMFELSEEEPVSILVPAGCVNGHLCLSERCLFFYKWSKKYNGPEKQITINYKDPSFDFKWKLENLIVSDRDLNKSINSTGVYL
jgi:dTDP-4-dehydrorhamnose 3,5-epimerase